MDTDNVKSLPYNDKVEIIKEFYKETQNIDVSVIVPENENDLFLIIDANGKTINASFSLDDLINSLKQESEEEQEQSTSYVSSGLSSNNTSSQTPQLRARDMREMVMDTNINMYFSGIMEVIENLASMSDETSNCNLNYSSCLSGELATYYATLNDTTKEDVIKLGNTINNLSISTAASLSICSQTTDLSLEELEELINELYNQTDEFINTINDSATIDEDEPLSYENYIFMFDNMGEIFDGSYKDILDRFKENLTLGYHDFLRNTVPNTLNNIIENTYLRISDKEIGSREYQEGLEEYKKSFGIKILNEYK